MDYHIVDQAPRGSALSAYGTARGFRWNLPLLALLAGSLVLGAGVLFFFATRSFSFPRYPLLTVIARPAALHATIPEGLRQSLPSPWRDAVATRSHLPAFFGIALDEAGVPHVFALAGGESFGVRSLPMDRLSLHAFFPDLRALFAADAAFVLRGDLLNAWVLRTSLTDASPSTLHGTWKQRRGFLPFSEHSTAEASVTGHLFAVLTDVPAGRTSLTHGLLAQGIDLRELSASPSTAALTASPLGNHHLTLTWHAPLSSLDQAIVLGAGGVLDPQNVLATFSTVVTTTQEVPSVPMTSTCPGTPRFLLEGIELQRTLEALGIPSLWQTVIQRVQLNISSEQSVLCIH